MARTYGEVLESSFSEIFSIATGEDTVFLDIGSGHGRLVIAAVQNFGCRLSVGIEKYRSVLAFLTADCASKKPFWRVENSVLH